jgi:hypothetical protein
MAGSVTPAEARRQERTISQLQLKLMTARSTAESVILHMCSSIDCTSMMLFHHSIASDTPQNPLYPLQQV